MDQPMPLLQEDLQRYSSPSPPAATTVDPPEEEVELDRKLEKILGVLDRADSIPWIELKDDAVWRWLGNLRRLKNDCIEEALKEEALKEDLKEALNEELKEKDLKEKKKVLYSIPCVLSCIKPDLAVVEKTEPDTDPKLLKVQEWIQKIDSIFKDDDVENFNSLIDLHNQQSASFRVLELGAQKSDKDALLNLLFATPPDKPQSSEDEPQYSVDANKRVIISIQGSEGSGKTTLAQILYDDKRVQDSFQVRKWVRVADSLDDNESVMSRVRSELEKDDNEVANFLSQKRFLLVFDDVRYNSDNNLSYCKSLLKHGAPGSIIMVTARHEFQGADHVHTVRPLSTSDCWSILKQAALSGNRELRCQVRSIGREFAKRCGGSPLVAKMVGDCLKSKATVQEWEDVLSDEIWQLKLLGVLSRLRYPNSFSVYDYCLPTEEKKCFSYCAVFPKDSQLNVERLVALWAAMGYIGATDDTCLEERGYNVAEYLVDVSLLTDVRRSIHTNKITSCKIDEDYYPVANWVSTELTMLQQKKMLGSEADIQQSLVIVSHCDLPRNLFSRLKDVNALVLSSCKLEQLSTEVGSLTHLKFLDLSGNPLKLLPETIGDLKCLESLHVHSCYLLLSLPKRIVHLRLRHLRINYTTDKLHHLPQRFEELTSIKTMDVFRVGGTYKNIGKLEKFNNLVDIRIAVHGEVQFSDADLQSKSKLENLELCFVGKGRDKETAHCIKELVPPTNLKMLLIEDYHGHILPRWILRKPLIDNLTRLSLRSAVNISSLPGLWKLSSLEFLWIYDMPNFTHLGCEFFGYPNELESADDSLGSEDDEEIGAGGTSFPNLETLRIEYLQNWVEWEDVADDVKRIKVMPSLRELIIADCPKLQVMPLRILGDTPWLVRKPYGKLRHKKYQTNDKPSTSTGKAVEIEHQLHQISDQINDNPSTSRGNAVESEHHRQLNQINDQTNDNPSTSKGKESDEIEPADD